VVEVAKIDAGGEHPAASPFRMINLTATQYRDPAVRIKDCNLDRNLQLTDIAHVERIQITRIAKLDYRGVAEPIDCGGAEIKRAGVQGSRRSRVTAAAWHGRDAAPKADAQRCGLARCPDRSPGHLCPFESSRSISAGVGTRPATTLPAELLSDWLVSTDLDSHLYGTQRRTKATLIDRRAGNLRAVQLLLGHTKIESTVRYLGIEVDDALAIAEQVDV
jgi:hypothetical protein